MKEQDYEMLAKRMVEDAWMRGCDISVLVEDIYDQRLWECIIENVKPELRDKIDFPNPVPRGTRGKDILKKFKDFVSEKLIICVDSDCEYLYDEQVWYIAKYIYHTVVYSKENFQCHHLSLNEICKDLTTKRYDNFQALLENISRKVAPLFYIWFYLRENQIQSFDETAINKETFKKILRFQGTEFDNIGNENILYQKIEERVNDILDKLRNEMGEGWYDATFEHDIPEIKNRLLEQYSIQEEKILDFYYGHSVLEEFVQPFMETIIRILTNLKIEEVRQNLSEATEQVINETISRIENIAKKDIDTKLSDSFKYLIANKVDQNLEKIKTKLATEIN
ncbi:DUF4435 domain-containing protein [Sphaerospermopsis torques-reginae]|uniref:DUF4435 domain-containing protein n=1 Tax=Sphaerospermopsis torques-reginae ITEP-024 TaxID=984208 RepID=A0ABX8WVX0_9CYAN|nr:DUF4435 domain-containing protein [Sphaerospermopsis torques-reginae]QYX30532.1 DUF4435 domain-containing protein [Sphaerospermopsis torques-reginae ITEP-024]